MVGILKPILLLLVLTVLGETGSTVLRSNQKYMFSINPTSWETANSDCQKRGNGVLVALDKFNEIKEILDDLPLDITATSFWTAGKYDARKQIWKWSNGQPIDSPCDSADTCPDYLMQWAENEPKKESSQSRLALQILDKGTAYYETQLSTAMLRYICESPY